jgi:PDZ domain-containing secreted protein
LVSALATSGPALLDEGRVGAPLRPLPPPPPLDRRIIAAAFAGVIAALVAVGLAFHPGTLVVRPDPPIDITDDVTVSGVPTRAPRGHYVLTAVSISEPNVFGLVGALWSGEETLPADRHGGPGPSRAAGREDFRASQRAAARAVAPGATVRFRRRDLVGPSAGLVYALLLADVTGRLDVADGRVVAATGALDDEGRVEPVAFVEVKRRVAVAAGAAVFVVPAGEGAPGGGVRTVSVASVDAAVAAVAGR